MSTEIHGIEAKVVTTEIESLKATYEQALADKQVFYDDQMARIPDQTTWDNLTQDEKIAEWDAEGAIKFSVTKTKKMMYDEIDKVNNFFINRDTNFKAIRDEHMTAMDAELENARTGWQDKEDYANATGDWVLENYTVDWNA